MSATPTLDRYDRHLECGEWANIVRNYVSGGLTVGRRAEVRCLTHDEPIVTVEVDRHADLTGEDYNSAVMLEVGRQIIAEVCPGTLDGLSASDERLLIGAVLGDLEAHYSGDLPNAA